MPAQRALHEAGIEQRGERILQRQANAGPALGHQARGRHPLPGRAVARREPPGGGRVRLSAARLRQHLVRNQEPQLAPDPREADSLPPRLRARRDVVVARQVAPLHAGAVVDGRERRSRRVDHELYGSCARIEGVGDDLGQDRLFDRSGISVTQVLEQVEEVDARLAHENGDSIMAGSRGGGRSRKRIRGRRRSRPFARYPSGRPARRGVP